MHTNNTRFPLNPARGTAERGNHLALPQPEIMPAYSVGQHKKKSLLYFKHTQRVMHITTKSRKPLYLISKWDCIALWALLHLGKRSRGIEAFAPFRFDDSYSISFSSCHCSHKLCSIPRDITMTLSLFPQWSSLCVHPPGHINLTKCQVSSKLFCFLFPSSKLRNSLWNKP